MAISIKDQSLQRGGKGIFHVECGLLGIIQLIALSTWENIPMTFQVQRFVERGVGLKYDVLIAVNDEYSNTW